MSLSLFHSLSAFSPSSLYIGHGNTPRTPPCSLSSEPGRHRADLSHQEFTTGGIQGINAETLTIHPSRKTLFHIRLLATSREFYIEQKFS